MRVFVGNLPFKASAADIRQHFEAHGATVGTVDLVMDRETGKPRGYGFVEVTNWTAIDTAKEQIDGTELLGRTLRIEPARERSSR